MTAALSSPSSFLCLSDRTAAHCNVYNVRRRRIVSGFSPESQTPSMTSLIPPLDLILGPLNIGEFCTQQVVCANLMCFTPCSVAHTGQMCFAACDSIASRMRVPVVWLTHHRHRLWTMTSIQLYTYYYHSFPDPIFVKCAVRIDR